MKNGKKLTQKRLKELLKYDSKTGFFTWVSSGKGGVTKGQIAGTPCKNNYIAIGVDHKRYYAHRLVWLYKKGQFPETGIDHINRDKTDNRFKNLRCVGKQGNSVNSGNISTNKSGIKGVAWHKKARKWSARIVVNRRNIHLGLYTTIAAAAKSRLEAENKYGFQKYNARSPAYLYLKKMGEV